MQILNKCKEESLTPVDEIHVDCEMSQIAVKVAISYFCNNDSLIMGTFRGEKQIQSYKKGDSFFGKASHFNKQIQY